MDIKSLIDPFALHLNGSDQPNWTPTSALVTNLNADLLDGQHGSYYASATGYVPYTGATTDVDLGTHAITTTGIGSFGKVGIGVTNPATMLDLYSNSQNIGIHQTGENWQPHQSFTEYINSANGPYMVFKLARGTSAATAAVSQDGDRLGGIFVSGYSGAASAFVDSSAIQFEVDGTPDSGGDTTDMPGRITFWTTTNGSGSCTEKMRIDNAGNITGYGNLTIGSGVAATDYTLTFNGETSDGVLTWLEDEKCLKLGRTGSGLWLDGSTGVTPTSGAGARLMWIPSKVAFRAGNVTGTQWDAGNIEDYTFGFGKDVIIAGANSAAFGIEIDISWQACNGFGEFINIAGEASQAFGRNIDISGASSCGIGISLTISGDNSFATGSGSEIRGEGGFCAGLDNIIDTGCPYSVCMGAVNLVSNSYAFAGGSHTNAAGYGSLCYGINEAADTESFKTEGLGSFAFGYATSGTLTATGTASVAMGQDVNAAEDNAIIVGKNAINDIPDSFMIATTNLGFYRTDPIAKPTVTGLKGGNAALGSLLTALANLGLITDSTGI